MEKGNEKAMSLVELPQKAIKEVQFKLKELKNGYKSWLAKQCLPVEAAIVTAAAAAHGGAAGALLGVLIEDLPSPFPTLPQASINPMAPFQQVKAVAGGLLVPALYFAVPMGVYCGVSCVLERLRGKEDLQSCVVASFGSGAAGSLASGMGGANLAANAVISGLQFAVLGAVLYKVDEMWQHSAADDTYYARTRGMLDKLGLQNYTKNFKKGLLTDSTLPLLTDRALREVCIPPGPRLLILDRIQRDPELKKSRCSCG